MAIQVFKQEQIQELIKEDYISDRRNYAPANFPDAKLCPYCPDCELVHWPKASMDLKQYVYPAMLDLVHYFANIGKGPQKADLTEQVPISSRVYYKKSIEPTGLAILSSGDIWVTSPPVAGLNIDGFPYFVTWENTLNVRGIRSSFNRALKHFGQLHALLIRKAEFTDPKFNIAEILRTYEG